MSIKYRVEKMEQQLTDFMETYGGKQERMLMLQRHAELTEPLSRGEEISEEAADEAVNILTTMLAMSKTSKHIQYPNDKT